MTTRFPNDWLHAAAALCTDRGVSHEWAWGSCLDINAAEAGLRLRSLVSVVEVAPDDGRPPYHLYSEEVLLAHLADLMPGGEPAWVADFENYKARCLVYHPPRKERVQDFIAIREAAAALAQILFEKCPDTPERQQALIRLDETVFHANAAIARPLLD